MKESGLSNSATGDLCEKDGEEKPEREERERGRGHGAHAQRHRLHFYRVGLIFIVNIFLVEQLPESDSHLT